MPGCAERFVWILPLPPCPALEVRVAELGLVTTPLRLQSVGQLLSIPSIVGTKLRP